MLRWLGSQNPKAPVSILALISADAPEHREKALEWGAQDYILHPFDAFELRHRLEALAHFHGAQQDKFGSLDFDKELGKFGDLPIKLYRKDTRGLRPEAWTVGNLKQLSGPDGVVLFSEVWSKLVHPKDRDETAEIYKCILENRSTEWRVRFRWFANNTSILHVGSFDAERQVVRGILLDVTAAKELRVKHIEDQKMAAMGCMAGGIAHDFNNLLCAILSFSKFAQDEMEPESQSWDDINEVIKAAERAASLTRQLLTFSGEKKPAADSINLNDRLSELNSILARLLGELVQLTVSTSARPAIALIDPIQFDQIVLNLAVNARDAMMPTGGRLNISLESSYNGNDRIALKVQDSGFGMDPETFARIFEPFFTTKPRGKGTGLGLATCFAIVDQAGGQIHVQSAPNEGTTFTVSLRRQGEVREGAALLYPLCLQTVLSRILLVEDEASVRYVCKRVLEKAGYDVYTAEDGREGVRRMEELGADLHLVISDVVMPEHGRYGAGRLYQQEPPSCQRHLLDRLSRNGRYYNRTSGQSPSETVPS